MFKKTVTSITAGLSKMADDLDALRDRYVAENNQLIDHLKATNKKIDELDAEATKAHNIANNIRSLLS